MLGALALDAGGSALAAWWHAGWVSSAALDLIVGLYLLTLLARPAWRPLVGRLLLLGLVAGVLELFTDAAGEHVAHSLIYPGGEPFLWASPAYMPFSWMIVLTQLGYLAWRLLGALPRRPLLLATVLTGVWSALNIPYYEEKAYSARWWAYTTRPQIGHTPLYVLLFEGLIGAALPVLVWGLTAARPRGVAARGVLLGLWMPWAALFAWVLLGR
jgi:hypothetical protein